MKERIQKVLSSGGYCSRRKAEELIASGKVTVNGHPAGLGDKADPARDVIAVSGQRVYLDAKKPKSYYIINKPRGYVTTLSDEMGRKTVADIMEETGLRLFPIGRLDKDSEGLLIMTDDGELANRVAHPSGGIKKTYRVSVAPHAEEQQLITLATGVVIDGRKTAPASVRVTGDSPDKTVFEITLSEGRNREIRRMCEAVGLTVTRLKRTSIGPIRLGNLPTGTFRELSKQELMALRNAISRKGK